MLHRRRALLQRCILAFLLFAVGALALPSQLLSQELGQIFGLTHALTSGNRVVEGNVELGDSTRLDIELGGVPVWLTALPEREGSVWVAVLESGDVEAVRVAGSTVTKIDSLEQGPWIISEEATREFRRRGDGPISVAQQGGQPIVVAPPAAAGSAVKKLSALSHPLVIPETASVAWISGKGELFVWKITGGLFQFDFDAPRDARIVVDNAGRIAVLSGATTSYAHRAVGDAVEASGVAVVSTFGTPSQVGRISLEAGRVIEGISPMWADLNGDGEPELVVTVTDGADGARINVYDPSGPLLAEGPPIGRGFRWRHQLAVAPFGQEPERRRPRVPELAVVRTPHLRPVIEFYRIIEGKLEIVSEIERSGLTSHRFGSRNLDVALAGNFAPGAGPELLLPDGGFGSLAVLQRREEGAAVVARLPAGGVISTNIAATAPRGRITVGVGRSDGVLRLWLPADPVRN